MVILSETKKVAPFLAEMLVPLVTARSASKLLKVKMATPVALEPRSRWRPKLLPQRSKSTPKDNLRDCKAAILPSSLYNLAIWAATPSMVKSLATEPGLVSKFG